MENQDKRFLKKLALYAGGIFDLILIGGLFLFGLVGKRIPLWMVAALFVSFYFTSWGWSGIKDS